MRCSKCGFDNPSGMKFCGQCTGPLALVCPNCHFENPPQFKFCGQCTTALGPGTADVRSSNPRTTTDEIDGPAALDGERKTVTALFADIKGSMELMEDFDPEEARAIVDPALKLMIDAVHRYDGHIVQSTGDGIFALFGAPVAHEDHPQRAVYAALRMQEGLRRYGDRMRAQGQIPLQMRIGANTGEVVVRSLQTGAGQAEYTPIGHSTSLAARLQTLATPGSTVIGGSTRRFVEGYFQLKDLGKTVVKGVSAPVELFEVTGLGPLRTRLQVAARRGLTRFIGRETEIAQMRRALALAREGHGQIIAAMGEAGVGKSRLFFEFKAVSGADCLLLEAYSVSHGKASPYLPVIELLRDYFNIAGEDDERRRREKIAGKLLMLERSLEDTLPYVFTLMGIQEGTDFFAQIDPQLGRRRTHEAIKRILLRESLNQPLILVFEDLHWIDAETQAFLNVIVDAVANARILLLANYRPEYRHEWGNRTYYAQLRLDPFGREIAGEMLSALLGDEAELDPVRRLIAERSEGNPFFIEEIVQALFEQGVLARNGAVKLMRPLIDVKVPPTVQAVLASRIDRLPADEKDLLQTLAVIGLEFRLQLIQRVASHSEVELERMLGNLRSGEFIYEQPAFPDSKYEFKHARTQEVAYNSVLLERRKILHERVGAAIEAVSAERIEDQFEELARHYGRSGNFWKAVEYMRLAGEKALRRSHQDEALAHARAALDLLRNIPDSREHLRAEMALLLIVSKTRLASRLESLSEAESALTRAYQIAPQIAGEGQAFPVIANLWALNLLRGEIAKSYELAMELLEIACKEQSDALDLEAHFALGDTLYWEGRFREALSHFEQVVAGDRSSMGMLNIHGWDSVAIAFVYIGLCRWQLGHPGEDLALIAQGVERAFTQDNRLTIGLVRLCTCVLRLLRREAAAAKAEAELLCKLDDDLGMQGNLVTKALSACVMLQQTPTFSTLSELSEIIRGFRSQDTKFMYPIFLASLAEGYGRIGEIETGLEKIAEAFALIEVSGEREREAELYRLQGELLQKRDRPNPAESEACFRQAIEIARSQEAKMFELRATTSLARLRISQGHRDEARGMLAGIYDWFTEGFDTADLKEAKAVLGELTS
jgi:class 3 adenylate cyclase/tetratricopeptide (TPR) repeat protein